MKKLCFLISLLLLSPAILNAQSYAPENIPEDVYYMLPSFANGTVFFSDRAPAKVLMNICAWDQTLRFIDRNDNELRLANEDNITLVQIDSVSFRRINKEYYRVIPVTSNIGIAVKRRFIYHDKPQNTTGAIVQKKGEYKLSDFDFEAYDEMNIYRGDNVYPVTQKSLRILFPSKKREISSYYTMPKTEEGLKTLLTWLAKE